jgi:hypothetical protein
MRHARKAADAPAARLDAGIHPANTLFIEEMAGPVKPGRDSGRLPAAKARCDARQP